MVSKFGSGILKETKRPLLPSTNLDEVMRRGPVTTKQVRVPPEIVNQLAQR